MNNIKKILLTGGGTGGSVSPLLAIYESLVEKQAKFEFLWIGTKNGPEKKMVEEVGINFKTIASGKLRRYFSWKNLEDLFKIFFGTIQSIFIIIKFKPDLVISAGSFVSVPVVFVAWFFRVKILIHQQDLRPGLANNLMSFFANVITVTFEKSLCDYGKKAQYIGNPVRKIFYQKLNSVNNFKNNLPIVLIIGGGTGSLVLNKIVQNSLAELTKICQVIHLTGKGKVLKNKTKIKNYQSFEFCNTAQIASLLQAAEIVVSRCGISTLTELSFLSKPSLLIPLANTHQEDNANFFGELKASIALEEKNLSKAEFLNNIKNLLQNKLLRDKLAHNIHKVIKKNANNEMVKIIMSLI